MYFWGCPWFYSLKRLSYWWKRVLHCLRCPRILNLVPEIAVIVNDPVAHLRPSILELESWNEEQQASFRQQIIANETKATKKDDCRSFTEEALKKRKGREDRRRLATMKFAEESNAEDINTPSPDVSHSKESDAMITQSTQISISQQPAASANYVITIPAASEYQWYNADQATFRTIAGAQKAGIWTYPSNLNERARCGVFQSLLAHGYFIGSGIKFGGDYLVYPG